MKTHFILKAVVSMGSQASLAKSIGAPTSLVWQWVHGQRPVAAKWCIPIEEATAGGVTRYQLRHDIFGTDPSNEVAA